MLSGSLFTIDESRVRAEARADVVLFQRECARVLADHFARKGRLALPVPASIVPPGVDAGQVAQIVEQIDTLSGAVNLMREHLAALLALPGQVEGISAQLGQAVAMLESLAQRQDAAETQLAQIDVRTQRLTPAHARDMQEMVDRMVCETAHQPVPLKHYIIYGRLKAPLPSWVVH